MAFDVRAALAEIRAGADMRSATPLAAIPAKPAIPAANAPGLACGVAEIAGIAPPNARMQKRAPIATLEDDAATLTEALRVHGPMTQGVAARALGWGATRAWRAEAMLRAAGALSFDACGRAVAVKEARNA